MYIKEDLIIPHHYSFYDLIVTKVSWEQQRGEEEEALRMHRSPSDRALAL